MEGGVNHVLLTNKTPQLFHTFLFPLLSPGFTILHRTMQDTEPEPDESTRLLNAESSQVPPLSPSPSPPPSPSPSPLHSHVWRITLTATAVSVAVNIGNYISWAAQTVLLQNIVCNNHYDLAQPGFGANLVDRCEAEPVQSEIAYINGWKDVFEMLPCKMVYLLVTYYFH